MSALTLSGKIRELLKIMGLAVDLPLLEALQIMEAAIGIVASGTWVERADRLKACQHALLTYLLTYFLKVLI